MENTIKIMDSEIPIKEYDGERVVTFKDIDTVHNRSEGTARKRFNDNRKHFIEGVDYYKVKCSEVRPFFGQTLPNGFNPNADVTLITETGYLMLVKSFTDDLAWRVQRELVNSYFRVKEMEETVSVIDTDKLIKCGEIMAGCLEGNRPYVINILRNIFPDIDFIQPTQEPQRTPDVSEKSPIKKRGIPIAGYTVGFNAQKFAECLWKRGISSEEFGKMLGCSSGNATKWKNGVKPGAYYRRLICEVLELPQGYFDKKIKKRR